MKIRKLLATITTVIIGARVIDEIIIEAPYHNRATQRRFPNELIVPKK